MKRLLLTGIGGSIAAHFLQHFMENTDWEVVGVDSFRHKGWMDRVVEVTKDHEDWKKRITIITHDLNAPFSELTERKIGHIDYIISMASLSDVEASIKDQVPFIQNNVNLIINLLEYARKAEPETFIKYPPTKCTEQYQVSMTIYGKNGTPSYLVIHTPLPNPVRKQLQLAIGVPILYRS